MEPNKILSANILDLIFDDRNKEYGAYELRVTYPERIKRSLIFVFVIAGLALTGMTLANKLKPDGPGRVEITSVDLTEITPDEKKPEKLPEPEKKPEQPRIRTEQYTTPVIKDDKEVETPPPTQDDVKIAGVGNEKRDGVVDDGSLEVKNMDGDKKIIDQPKETEPEIYPVVQIPAKYDGDWIRFLTRNLNAEVPVDNGAPAGSYSIIIQFVVDKEGELSDIKALTNYGYGMEQEAIRVLRKAKGWRPGIQNGHEVKSYHKQPITFIVTEG